ncbi:hypothetical protein ACFY1P_14290 [Streptomyces sp. NPDC001407]|uniref:hypothetical protein n=1 Tax=unclassified Streptomyces TaxID=2593676 RepID=UPI0033FCB322
MGKTELSRPLGRTGGRADTEPPGGSTAARFADRPVRPHDLVTRAFCRALPPLCAALGLRQTAATLRHYLRGTGTPYRVDAALLLALPEVRSAAEEQLARWRTEALARWRGAPSAYPADSGWRAVTLPRRGALDWWLALRAVDYRLTGTVRVSSGGEVVVDYRFAVSRCRRFAGGLHEAGLAREFLITGEAFGHA